MQVDIVGIDEYPVVDLLLNIDKLPTTDRSTSAYAKSWQCGGKVSTALAAAGRLGAKTGIIGIVGADNFGRFCEGDFRRHGVDTTHLLLEPGKTTTFSVALSERSTKGRSFIGVAGSCRRLQERDLAKEYIQNAKYLHLSQITPTTLQAAHWAKEVGVTVVFDGDEFDLSVADNLALIDVMIASEFFFRGMFPDSSPREGCERLRQAGPKLAIITLGARGCVGVDDIGFFEQPAFLQAEVIDTTGAGDVFHGAFIYAMLQGMSPQECARFSCAVASIKCSRQGGRAGIPSRTVVDRFLADGMIDYTEIDERVAYYAECHLGDEVLS